MISKNKFGNFPICICVIQFFKSCESPVWTCHKISQTCPQNLQKFSFWTKLFKNSLEMLDSQKKNFPKFPYRISGTPKLPSFNLARVQTHLPFPFPPSGTSHFAPTPHETSVSNSDSACSEQGLHKWSEHCPVAVLMSTDCPSSHPQVRLPPAFLESARHRPKMQWSFTPSQFSPWARSSTETTLGMAERVQSPRKVRRSRKRRVLLRLIVCVWTTIVDFVKSNQVSSDYYWIWTNSYWPVRTTQLQLMHNGMQRNYIDMVSFFESP
jgi:hypothetical protein